MGSGAAAGADTTGAGAATVDSTGAGSPAGTAADGTAAVAGRVADATGAGALDGKAAEGTGKEVAATDRVGAAADTGSAPCKGRLHRPTRPMRVLGFIIGISCFPLYRQPGPSP
ncbi:hypothetical protein CF122_00330 [Aeromonas media]|nr:hypothetical protein CF122_00330 [Aeromonas media]